MLDGETGGRTARVGDAAAAGGSSGSGKRLSRHQDTAFGDVLEDRGIGGPQPLVDDACGILEQEVETDAGECPLAERRHRLLASGVIGEPRLGAPPLGDVEGKLRVYFLELIRPLADAPLERLHEIGVLEPQ